MNWFYRPLPLLLRPWAWVLAYPFSLLAALRVKLYGAGWLPSQSMRVPVVSLGNLTVGGTGKSPMASWLVDFAVAQGLHPAVLTRGYKSQGQGLRILEPGGDKLGMEEVGDEPWMLHLRHPKLSIYISPKRVEAAEVAQQQANLLILDDGMQHLALQRELDLVLVDATRGLGNGLTLPLGPLREGVSALRRASALLVTKSNLCDPTALVEQLKAIVGEAVPLFLCPFIPEALVLGGGPE